MLTQRLDGQSYSAQQHTLVIETRDIGFKMYVHSGYILTRRSYLSSY